MKINSKTLCETDNLMLEKNTLEKEQKKIIMHIIVLITDKIT